jgi:hypothetical protein
MNTDLLAEFEAFAQNLPQDFGSNREVPIPSLDEGAMEN